MDTLQTSSPSESLHSVGKGDFKSFDEIFDFEAVETIALMRQSIHSLERHLIRQIGAATKILTEKSIVLNNSNVSGFIGFVQSVHENMTDFSDKINGTENEELLSTLETFFAAIKKLEVQIENYILKHLEELSKQQDSAIDSRLLEQLNSNKILKNRFDAFREAHEIRSGVKKGHPIETLFDD